MLITLFAKLLAIEHTRERDELSAFIHSKQFKVSIGLQLVVVVN